MATTGSRKGDPRNAPQTYVVQDGIRARLVAGKHRQDGSRITIGHTGSSGTACSMDFQKQGYWILFTQMPQPKSPELAPHIPFTRA